MKGNRQRLYFSLIFIGSMFIAKAVTVSFDQPNLVKHLILASMGLILLIVGFWMKRKYNLLDRK